MSSEILFYIIIGVLTINFLFDQFLDIINSKYFNKKLPKEIEDVYNQEEYLRSQAYKKTTYKFGIITASFSFIVTICFFLFDGFEWVDNYVRSLTDNYVLIALLFFGIIMFASNLLSLPFSYYSTFVIEEEYGFNKTTPKTFMLDKLKGGLLGAVIGGLILYIVIKFYELTGVDFWIYAWILIAVFSVFMNMFYSKLIVPLFNKQKPLTQGDLRHKIEAYSHKVGFKLNNIFVIDGSKRSTKANAYFSGFGKEKRITLYDTLINDLDDEEIVAVLAHEVGHYQKKHIIFNLVISILITGFTLWLLSLFINNPIFSYALGVKIPSFHIGLVAFGVLYSPISEITGLLMNYISRKFEYQADNFAKETFNASSLISGLKKLSGNSLSNLTPHPLYVFFHYSHPTLLQRIKNLTHISTQNLSKNSE